MTFRSLSLGAGQGSTALVIAIADKLVVNGYDFGAISLDWVAFSDTRADSDPKKWPGEVEATYAHVEKLRAYLAPRGVTLHVVKRKGVGLAEKVTRRARNEIKGNAPAIPFHLAPEGKAQQHCTYDYKSIPLDRATKRAAKAAGKLNDVEVLIGFTIDEWKRVRDPREDWPDGWRFRYPMIEAKVGRGWCQDVCRSALGYVPQTSACAFCPHRPDVGPGGRSWIAENEPETWAKVIAFDAAIRDGYGGLRQRAYVSGLRVPVAEALTAAQRQGEFWKDGGDGCDDGRCFT